MASLMALTEYATEESIIINLDNVDLVRMSPFEGTRIYFMYANDPEEAEFVDVVESIDSILDDLEDMLPCEEREENDGQTN